MPASITTTTIYCPATVRNLWPDPQASVWLSQYPEIFDADDLRIAKSQPQNHFAEWFTAVHLFHRGGFLSLVEKYGSMAHPHKVPILKRVLTPELTESIDSICARCGVQAPDLLVYSRDYALVSFAEVKGPGDALTEKQRRSHQLIVWNLDIPIEVFTVKIVASTAI